MGQRLTMVIQKNNEDIAVVYQHWSAYTVSTLFACAEFVKMFYSEEYSKYEDIQLRILRVFEDLGGGITSEDREWIKNKWPFRNIKEENISRNEGLVAFSEDARNSLLSWTEGIAYVNLDNEAVINEVICTYDDYEDYEEQRKEWDSDFDGNIEIPELTYNPICVNFEDLIATAKELDKLPGYVGSFNGRIHELIA